jgi:hypothetical protein
VSNLGTQTKDFLCYIYYTVQTLETSDVLLVFLDEYPLGMQANSLRNVFRFGFRSPLLCRLGKTRYPPSATLTWALVDLIPIFQENSCALT